MAVVVLPTPPFWLAIAITFPNCDGLLDFEMRGGSFPACPLSSHPVSVPQDCSTWNVKGLVFGFVRMFHVEQFA